VKAIGHLLERLTAAEHVVAQRKNPFARLSNVQVALLDAFYKQVMNLPEDVRNSRLTAFLRCHADIAGLLCPGTLADQ